MPNEQTCPQEPQLLGSVLRLTQVPPHWTKPALQLKPQAPFEQVGVEFGGVEQKTPQPPQLVTSEFVLTQTPPQLVVPVGQPHCPIPLQMPFEHAVPVGLFTHAGWPIGLHVGT
jgi:hypothetical protein